MTAENVLDVKKEIGLQNGSGPVIDKNQWNFRIAKPKSRMLSEPQKLLAIHRQWYDEHQTFSL